MLARYSRFQAVGGNTPYSWVACGDPKLEYKFVCVLRASARKTHKLVEKDYLRRSRNVYGVLPLQSQEAEGFLGTDVMGTR